MTHLHHRSTASLDMTEGAIWPILLQFTIPLLLGNLFQLLYNTVDSMVAGNFVEASLYLRTTLPISPACWSTIWVAP